MKYRRIKCPIVVEGHHYTAYAPGTGEAFESVDLAAILRCITADMASCSGTKVWKLTHRGPTSG